MIDKLPILGICGFSGSGKTTLLEGLAAGLVSKGLKVAIVKHDAHGIDVDRPGKDSDRLYRAGADVLIQGPGAELLRLHRPQDSDLLADIVPLVEDHDLVLVEGHKRSPLKKIWLLGDDEAAPPPEARNVAAVLPRHCDRLATALPMVDSFLTEQWTKTPLLGCVLIGGKSTRMGTPKHLLEKNGQTWLVRTVQLFEAVTQTVVIAGAGDVPQEVSPCLRMADSPNVEGPLAGLLAAMRWAPHASWLVAACDLPELSADALSWLVSTRPPGAWATLPRLAGSCRVEPLLAHYDFRSRPVLSRQALGGNFRLSDLADHPKVISPTVPAHIAPAWKNINTPTDLNTKAFT